MDLDFFRTHHYQVLRGVIDRDVALGVRDFLAAQAQLALEQLKGQFGASTQRELCAAIDDAYSSGAAQSLPHEMQLNMTGHFPVAARLSPVLWEIPKLPAVRAVLEQVIGSERLFMHLPPAARFVMAGNTRAAVPAHRDASYNAHMSDFVIMWVPFTRIDDECGGVAIFEGSERDTIDDSERTGFWIRGASMEGRRRVHPHLDVGDAILMSQWIVHESSPNLSDRLRYSVDFRFMGESQTSTKHLLDMQRWSVLPPGSRAAAEGSALLSSHASDGQRP